MTGERPFSIVDVFAEAPYAGNHLAVVRNAGHYTDDELRGIARDIGPAAFIASDEPGDDGYAVRVFTPEKAVPFSGHPVVGAAGHAVRRPSVLHVRAAETSGRIEVHVGGSVMMIARGSLLRYRTSTGDAP